VKEEERINERRQAIGNGTQSEEAAEVVQGGFCINAKNREEKIRIWGTETVQREQGEITRATFSSCTDENNTLERHKEGLIKPTADQKNPGCSPTAGKHRVQKRMNSLLRDFMENRKHKQGGRGQE